MKKKTRILIEIERVRVSYQMDRRLETFCHKCGTKTDFLSREDATIIIGDQPLNDFHTEFTPNKQLIFCLKSILERLSI